MSDCYTPDESYEAVIGSLTNDIHKLQDDNYALEQRHQQLQQVARNTCEIQRIRYRGI